MTEQDLAVAEELVKKGYLRKWFDPEIGEYCYGRTEKGKRYHEKLRRLLQPN